MDQTRDGALKEATLWVSGEGGYHTYRIPALAVTTRGTLLAFCEGRKRSARDTGDIDLLLRRSLDGGETFGPVQVVWDDGPNTCGNPCPVVDRHTGVIWLLLTHNLGGDTEAQIKARTSKSTRTVWVCHSDDDGVSWSKPVDITESTKRPDWTWYATGPGVGIQLRNGRLVVPCDAVEAGTQKFYSLVIYSDDHGRTWRLGGWVGDQVNECQVAELADGTLLLNMRNYDRSQATRAIATNRDGGLTWSAVRHDHALVEPVCQASLIGLGCGPSNRLLFSNPASRTRDHLTVRLSEDGGNTWVASRVLYPGPAAYSCLAELPDGRIACLYERGVVTPYETLTLARFPLEWLTGAA